MCNRVCGGSGPKENNMKVGLVGFGKTGVTQANLQTPLQLREGRRHVVRASPSRGHTNRFV